jgi:7-carboxy-7-deazaguanine synthase
MRVSELYTSIQGEGPGIGRATQFVRFAGCNLRCPGWPCDTQHAIDPAKYRHEWETVAPDELYARIRRNDVQRVTLTGGEPFLQPHEQLDALVRVWLSKYYDIEVFTNGTLDFSDWVQNKNVSVIMDWKLPGSGEGEVKLDTRIRNLGYLGSKDAVKFVCTCEDDFDAAVELVQKNPELFINIGHIYAGAAWGKTSEADVAQWLIESRLPWKLNVQIHNYVWNRDERGI